MAARRVRRRNATPFIPGAEVAGTVVAVGPNVTGFEIGTPVVSAPPSGGYAQFVVAPIAPTFPIPQMLSAVEVVSLHGAGTDGGSGAAQKRTAGTG